jgi:hypothetical protein
MLLGSYMPTILKNMSAIKHSLRERFAHNKRLMSGGGENMKPPGG